MNAPWDSTAYGALGALRIGDISGITAVVGDGTVQALLSHKTL